MKKIDSGSGVKMEKNVSLSSVPLGFFKISLQHKNVWLVCDDAVCFGNEETIINVSRLLFHVIPALTH